MLKKSTIFFGGYLIILLILYILNEQDKFAPSFFGKWAMILTPVYLVAFFIANYFISKKTSKNEK